VSDWERIYGYEDYATFIYPDLNRVNKDQMTFAYYQGLEKKYGPIFLGRRLKGWSGVRYEFSKIPENPRLTRWFKRREQGIRKLYNKFFARK
jgi:hypothetical protein